MTLARQLLSCPATARAAARLNRATVAEADREAVGIVRDHWEITSADHCVGEIVERPRRANRTKSSLTLAGDRRLTRIGPRKRNALVTLWVILARATLRQ
jgi:hypothetical protein